MRNVHRRHRAARRALGLVALPFLAATGAAPAAAERPQNCLAPGADCTLAEAAHQSGIFVGAAVGNELPDLEIAGVLAHFNAMTTENAFKWGSLSSQEGVYDFGAADRLVDFARRNQLRLRAHTLVWHRDGFLGTPQYVRDAVAKAEDPAARLRELMRQHIETVVARYRGRVDLYDVVNEPLSLFTSGFDTEPAFGFAANVFFETLGVEYIDLAFRWTHAVDPRAKLFLNEIVWDPHLGDPKADAFLALASELVARGVPIDGVGIQTHGQLSLTSPFFPSDSESFAEYMRAFAALGLRLEITELDVPLPLLAGASDPLAAQAEVYRRVVRACATASNCSAVTTWNVHDGRTWLDFVWPTSILAPNEPLLLDASLRPKPAYFATRDALLERCEPPSELPGPTRVAWTLLRRLGAACSRAYPRPFPPPWRP